MTKTPAPPAPPAPDAIPDDLILAAIERAGLHRARRGAPMWQIQAHLSLPRRSGRAQQVRARVFALTDVGLLEQSREHSKDIWTLTPAARHRLRRAKGIADTLPESPQHQEWRRARTLAAQEIGRFAETLRTSLAEATAMLDAEAPTSSEAWFDLVRRLERQAWRLGSAMHCLYEWEEPSDDAADIDDGPQRGRRNVSLWHYREERGEG